jgi:hypothetical protein
MRRSEWIAAGYFVYVLLAGEILRLRGPRRVLSGGLAFAAALAVVAVSRLPHRWEWQLIRDWMPGLYLLAGYWLSGRLFTAPSVRIERWLAATDRRLAEVPLVRWASGRIPPVVREYFELTYLFCYPLVPLAFAIVYSTAGATAGARTDATDRFWSVVLLASYVCYGALPWMPTRPPRVLDAMRGGSSVERGLQRVNLAVLNRASIHVNTFPSAHVAGSLASALVVGEISPPAGLAIGVIAASIAIASVIGRYHYAADAGVGAVLAFVVYLVVR